MKKKDPIADFAEKLHLLNVFTQHIKPEHKEDYKNLKQKLFDDYKKLCNYFSELEKNKKDI